ncbi:MAG: efflux RND transporter periplasmic adaptor subunit [Bacteroidales bacterium]|nr:efflux RND transporter periplasmic adaptor subunit [Bacteroidales bacterium]
MRDLIVFGVFIMFVSCGRQKVEQSASPELHAETLAIVETEEVDAITSATRTHNQPTFNGVLFIPPQYHATVTLFMDGVVKSTSLLSGVYVKKGDLLAVLENPEYIALQQSYLESHAQEIFLEAEYRRQEVLADGEAASKKALQQSKADYLSMKSRREATAAQLKLLGFDPVKILSTGIAPQLELRSPIEGYVANVQVNTGKYVAAGDPICDVVDKNRMMLKLAVYEKDIDKIKMGDKMEFRVNGMGMQLFEATVISLGQMVDNTSRSLDVYAQVAGSNVQFRPGMYVNAQIK